MSKHLEELVELLVEEIYGGLAFQAFSTLVRHGRQPLSGILQYSTLSRKQVNHALGVLVQQHLVHHHTPPPKEEDDPLITYFEAHLQNAYNLLRSGKIILAIERRFGGGAAGLVADLLSAGHARIGDLEAAYSVKPSARDSAIAEDQHIHSPEQLYDVLRQLLRNGYIVPVRGPEFKSIADLHDDADRLVREQTFNMGRTKREREDLAERTHTLKRQWREETEEMASTAETASNFFSKGGDNHYNKKHKGDNNTVNGINGTYGHGGRLGQDLDVRLSEAKAVLQIVW